MKKKLVLTCAMAAALAIPVVAEAGSGRDRVTGGGQVLVSTEGGAGDTIAFTAQAVDSVRKGEAQYVDRTGGTGQGQTTYHGDILCIRVEGNKAKLAGTWRESDGGGSFQILVIDNGQGANSDDDLVTVQNLQDPTCDDEDDDDDAQTALARGNAQVYDASASKRSSKRSKRVAAAPALTYTKAVSLAGLR
jgi:hypothetical protein